MTLRERDRNSVWHPYTQVQTADPPIAIVRGEGARVFDESGKTYIDAVSSWWVNIHGHCNPRIAAAIAEQAARLEHVIFAGFTHIGAVELAERLLAILPGNLSKIFYSDDGSTAVEVAVKMALQYWHNRRESKTSIIAFENAYHGDTFGAMSVSGDSAFTAPFAPLLFPVVRIPAPFHGRERESIAAMEKALESGNAAAFLFEPLVMGTAGMLMYEPEPLDTLIAMCRAKGVPTIADEVFTGFGRTGKYFACDYIEHKPDIICLSKGITGGFMPFGATACSEEIFGAFLSDDKMKTFFHGHSYTANPLACAAALASLDILQRSDCMERIRYINARHNATAERLRAFPSVKEARVTGTILAVELHTQGGTSYFSAVRDAAYRFFLGKGIIMRPLGNIIYFLPPYCITELEMTAVEEAMEEWVRRTKTRVLEK